MAPFEFHATIIFAEGQMVEVANTREEIRTAIAACTVPHVALITLQNVLGEEIDINAAQIRLIQEPKEPRAVA